MARVLEWPHKMLTRVVEPVPHGEKCRDLIEAMFESMDFPTGIGLAAPQIGENKRIIVIKVPALKRGRNVSGATKHVIINPEIFWKKGEMEIAPEGCLSFPGAQVMIPRWPRIKVRGFDIKWNPITIGGKGLIARVLQHEIDHLMGRTLDHYVRLAANIGQDVVISNVTEQLDHDIASKG